MGLLVSCASNGEELMSLPAPYGRLRCAGSELNQEKQTCTFRGQGEKKDSCKLLLSTVGVSQGGGEGWNRSESSSLNS